MVSFYNNKAEEVDLIPHCHFLSYGEALFSFNFQGAN